MSDNRSIGTGREGKRIQESLEGHASSSSQPAVRRRQPNVVIVEHPGGEIEMGFRAPVYSDRPTKVGEKMGIFIFEVFVTPDDLDLDRLLIPVEEALDYFPIFPYCPDTYKKKIVIYDHTNFEWPMTLRYDRSDCFFALESTWKNFVFWNHLDVSDVLRFYKLVPISQKDYYLVEIVKRRDRENINEFEPQDFLFQLQLSDAEILLERLFIPIREVRTHFPEVGIPADTHHLERLYFTDHLHRFWCIKIVCHQGTYQLLMDEFIKAHNLEEGDMLMLYKPIRPLNSRHFLIHFVKHRVTPTQLGTAAVNDSTDRGGDRQGDGGGGTDRGGNTQGGGGGGGGRSRSGRRRKWLKSSFGGCCMALKNNARREES